VTSINKRILINDDDDGGGGGDEADDDDDDDDDDCKSHPRIFLSLRNPRYLV